MSQIRNYTLQQFQNLANNSADNQELRIRQSNQDLSSTPLGFFARIFKHSSSNIEANQAFIRTISQDQRYQDISAKLARTLRTTMPENQPLTAAKVKAAVRTAEQMLETRQNALNAASKMVANKLIPENMQKEFARFFIAYQKKHPDINLSLKDFGDHSLLSQEQQQLPPLEKKQAMLDIDGARLENFQSLLIAFYSSKNRFQRADLFRVMPSDCQGDPAKANALTNLVNKCYPNETNTPKKLEDFLSHTFSLPAIGKSPSKGDILSYWKDDLHDSFKNDMIKISAGNTLEKLSTEQINKLSQHLPPNATFANKRTIVQEVTVALNRFISKHEAQFAENVHIIDPLINDFCELIKNNKTSRDDFQNVAFGYAIKLQLNDDNNFNIDGQNIFTKHNIDPEFGKQALSNVDFQASLVKLLRNSKLTNDADIKRIVFEEVNKFLQANANILQDLAKAHNTMDKKMPTVLCNLALPMQQMINLLQQKTSEFDIINHFNAIAERFVDPKLSDEDRGKLLKTVIDVVFSNKSVEERVAFCSKNKPIFENIIGQLYTLSTENNSLNESTQTTVNDLNLFLRSLYTGLQNTLPDEQALALQLNIQKKQVDPDVAAQINQANGKQQNAQKLERDATAASIFATIKNEKVTNDLNAKLIEKLQCTNVNLINDLIDVNTVETTLNSVWESKNYDKKLANYISQIEKIGSHVINLQAKYPEYKITDLIKLYMDALIETIPSKDLPALYDALKSDTSKLVLTVLMNHTNQELATLPPGKSNAKVDTMLHAFRAMTYLAEKVSTKLERPSISNDLFLKDTDLANKNIKPTDLTIRDLPFQPFLGETVKGLFPRQLTQFDEYMFDSKTKLNNEQYNQLKNFFNNLVVYDAKGKATTIKKADSSKDFVANFVDSKNQPKRESWQIDQLAMLFSMHAGEISELLTRTNGLPNPEDLWQIMHGGAAPADLTMQNFTQKLMNKFAAELNVYKTIVNQPHMTLTTFFAAAKVSYGISPVTLLQKMSKAQNEDFTIELKDQTLHDGMFTFGNGSKYQFGAEAYGFGTDFARAGMPLGAQGAEGNKITVIVKDVKTDFTKQEFDKINADASKNGVHYAYNDSKHPLYQQLVSTVRPLCASDAQLASVGLCTGQTVQSGLGALKTGIYPDCTGHLFEHCALDFTIEGSPDGHVKVHAKEKPGSLLTLNMHLDVDQTGKITVEQGSISYPSLNKLRAYKEAHIE